MKTTHNFMKAAITSLEQCYKMTV